MAIRGEALRAQILKFILDNKDGVRFAALAQKFRGKVSERTLSRALNDLLDQKHILRSGRPNLFTYSAKPYFDAKLDLKEHQNVIPFKKDSQEILRYISLPKEQRTPMGYNRHLLDSYIPNVSFYLDDDIRDHLFSLGTIDNAKETEDVEVGNTALSYIYQRLLIDLSWASSRLEGNTYSLLETEQLLATGEPSSEKDLADATMILNHRDAILYMIENKDVIGISRVDILNIHGILSRDLMPDPKDEGSLRKKIVQIGHSAYLPPVVPQVVEECFRDILSKGAAIDDPIEQSFFLMVHLPYLQPFSDVNKRTSRLTANIPLLKAQLSPLSFLDVPKEQYIQGTLGVYEINKTDVLRDVFVWAYERSCGYYAAQRQELQLSEKPRLTYRKELTSVTRTIIQEGSYPSDEHILSFAENIPTSDKDVFVRLVKENLDFLSEGNFARYKIRPEEFQAWLSAQTQKPDDDFPPEM